MAIEPLDAANRMRNMDEFTRNRLIVDGKGVVINIRGALKTRLRTSQGYHDWTLAE
jgi:hypothetical protein